MNLKETLDTNVRLKKEMVAQAEWWKLKFLPYAHELNEMLSLLCIYHARAEFYPEEKTNIAGLRATLSRAFGVNGTWEKRVDGYNGSFYFVKEILEGDYEGELMIYTEMPPECRLIKEETTRTTYKMECSKK